MKPDPTRCILIAVLAGGAIRDDSALDELASLATSAGLTPAARITFRRDRPHPALMIGPGQADRVANLLKLHEAGLAVFDGALGPVQQRNLNQRWEVPVLDRTELILEIFASRAQSREGKLQVELARLEHLSTRLVRGWTHLERQRGGIGGRGGPGEKQVELDRRMLASRVKKLRKELDTVRRQRANRRRARHRNRAIKISLVGYTNAGKSTLFNRLTGAGTMAADQLFATLDTLTRQVYIPGIGEVMLSDTVGFVRDLPHQLVDAFKATLEETAEADLLLHVIDGASVHRRDQAEQVRAVLADIGAGSIPVIEVYNKLDQLTDAGGDAALMLPAEPVKPVDTGGSDDRFEVRCDSITRVAVSAVTGAGVEDLKRKIAEQIGRSGQGEVAVQGDSADHADDAGQARPGSPAPSTSMPGPDAAHRVAR